MAKVLADLLFKRLELSKLKVILYSTDTSTHPVLHACVGTASHLGCVTGGNARVPALRGQDSHL